MDINQFALICLMLAAGLCGAILICFGGLLIYDRWRERRIADRKEED